MKLLGWIGMAMVLCMASCGKEQKDESASQVPAPTEQESPTASKPAAVPGKGVYSTYCLVCHQADGNGVPGMNPPLAGSEWVTGDKTRLINVILNGLQEEIVVKGETYNNVMAAHDFLSDKQIADVLTYIRGNFGNDAGPVTQEEVATVRADQ